MPNILHELKFRACLILLVEESGDLLYERLIAKIYVVICDITESKGLTLMYELEIIRVISGHEGVPDKIFIYSC